jgi:hypothetical protein
MEQCRPLMKGARSIPCLCGIASPLATRPRGINPRRDGGDVREALMPDGARPMSFA